MMAERDGAKSGIRDMVAASKGYLYRRAGNEARSTNASLDHVTGALSAFNKIRLAARAGASSVYKARRRRTAFICPSSSTSAHSAATRNFSTVAQLFLLKTCLDVERVERASESACWAPWPSPHGLWGWPCRQFLTQACGYRGGAKRHRKILRDNIQGITKPVRTPSSLCFGRLCLTSFGTCNRPSVVSPAVVVLSVSLALSTKRLVVF